MPFPPIIRNTYRKSFVRCPTLARWLYEEGLEGEPRVDLHAGAAFARGLEVARRTGNVEQGRLALVDAYGSFPCPPTSNKTCMNMQGALLFYFQEYPLGREPLRPLVLDDGKLAVELHFSWPLDAHHPTTGEFLRYEGRMDWLAEDEAGDVWVVDEKTTGRLGDAWSNQWYLDAGLVGYVYSASQFTPKPIAGAKIRGIAIQKTGYAKCEVTVPISGWEQTRWRAQLDRDVDRWLRMHKTGVYDQALDHACALYTNPCQFLPLCKSRDPRPLLDMMRAQGASK